MKKTKTIIFQKQLVQLINKETSDEIVNVLVPKDRIIIKYVEGVEADLERDGILVETDDIEENLVMSLDDMTSGNPDNVDLSQIGSQELLAQLLLNIDNKINT